MRPAFTKQGPAGWALDEDMGSVVLSDFPRANGSTAPPSESHSSPFSLPFFLMLFYFIFLSI